MIQLAYGLFLVSAFIGACVAASITGIIVWDAIQLGAN